MLLADSVRGADATVDGPDRSAGDAALAQLAKRTQNV
jgi:hypothetical protein